MRRGGVFSSDDDKSASPVIAIAEAMRAHAQLSLELKNRGGCTNLGAYSKVKNSTNLPKKSFS